MRKKLVSTVNFVLIALMLTGCWDTNNIVDQKIISGIGIDLAKNGSIMGTVRASRLESKGGGQFEVKDELVRSTGKSLLEIANKLDNILAGRIVGSKTNVIIIDGELAKRGIYDPLESIYRNPKGYLGSKILISQGQAADILSSDKLEKSPIPFEILQLIEGAEGRTVIPDQTLYTLWSKIFDTGRDTVLPMIRIKNSKNLVIDSIALFDGDRFTGEILSEVDNTLLLLLMDEIANIAPMNIGIDPIHPMDKPEAKGPEMIAFFVRKMKREMHISVDKESQKITCSIKVDLYGEIIGYPHITGVEKDKERLSRALSLSLNEKAKAIAKILLKSNCDVFGIESHLSAFHSKFRKSMNWDEQYKEVRLEPEFKVHISGTGVLK